MASLEMRDMHDMAERDRVDSWATGMSRARYYSTRPLRVTEQPEFTFSNYWGPPGGTAVQVLDASAEIFKPAVTAPKAIPTPKVLSTTFIAAGKALGIPALLEAILFELPECDLLTVQRVSKMWQAAIEKSKGLQERLFFQSAPSKHTFLVTRTTFDSRAFPNRHRFRTLIVVQDRVPAVTRSSGYLRSAEVKLNPLVGTLLPLPCKGDLDSRAALGERVRIRPKLLNVWFGSTRAPPSVWNMYLTQPPTSRVTVSIFDDYEPQLPLRKIVKKAGGVKFGDILEAYGMLIIAWKTTVSSNCPAHLVDTTMCASPQPNLFVLFDPAQGDVGNSILIPSDRDIKMVQARAELAAAEKELS
ncbi:hypothetical protein CB0940_03275 [Cercospora beticola]|uniref:F-box domain-containing protein n=1 Tax=Cercospora beticola TaxID=122368 RepID=A0A2G5I1L7_CERBT|nr:hypothetical protein CB0940_03275 [Cercospora beticola]PIA98670.1 hypothetical protein CB0940_03275 [Cercospora beticola]WPB00450.1 hypothetical protein RHO25_005069 [Cercospora beticola]CAK1361338.1 unnamed protein product [Cercospora beticola]